MNNDIFDNAIRDGIREGVKAKINAQYSNPLDKYINESIAKHAPAVQLLLEECIASCIGDKEFREQIAVATRHAMAKTLIQRFGGEIEKQVNVLKSDPTTRARITLAIEEIVKTQPH